MRFRVSGYDSWDSVAYLLMQDLESRLATRVSRMIVSRCTSVMRSVLRIELPSTSAEITATFFPSSICSSSLLHSQGAWF
jgi:hypothetical protein